MKFVHLTLNFGCKHFSLKKGFNKPETYHICICTHTHTQTHTKTHAHIQFQNNNSSIIHKTKGTSNPSMRKTMSQHILAIIVITIHPECELMSAPNVKAVHPQLSLRKLVDIADEKSK